MIKNNSSFNCILTEFYRPLYEKFFLPCFINSKIKLNTIKYEEVYGQGFNQPEFVKTIIFKIKKIIESLEKNKLAVWADVDIIFFEKPEKIIKEMARYTKKYDIAISPETRRGSRINSGFFAARGNYKTISFFKHLLLEVERKKASEQPIMQSMLDSNMIDFRVLPINYWNTTVGLPFPKPVKMIHANWVEIGEIQGSNYVENKMYALEKLKNMTNDNRHFF